MSSQASFVTVPSATRGNLAPVGYLLQHVGSVYEATPTTVTDGRSQGFRIDPYGHLRVIGTAPINSPQLGDPVSIGGRYDLTLPTYNDGDQVIDQHDANGRKFVTDDQLLAAFNAEDFATETSLAALLAAFTAEDFATETSLAALLAAFNAEDFATETTLAALLAAFSAEDFATETTLAAAAGYLASIAAEDFATETSLAALLAAFTAEDFATETTLAAILADTAIMSGWDTDAGPVGANTQRVHLSDESLAALENITVEVNAGDTIATFYNDAALVNIPGNASLPLQVIASTAADIQKVQVFDTMGFFLEIMLGAVSSEVRKFLIGPGSNETIEVFIPAGTRISVRRVDGASALNVGSLALNFIS